MTSSTALWAISEVRSSSSSSSSNESNLELAVITRPPVLVAESPKSTSISTGPLGTNLRPVVDCIGSGVDFPCLGSSGFSACSKEAALSAFFLSLRSLGGAAKGSGTVSSSSSHSSPGSSVGIAVIGASRVLTMSCLIRAPSSAACFASAESSSTEISSFELFLKRFLKRSNKPMF